MNSSDDEHKEDEFNDDDDQNLNELTKLTNFSLLADKTYLENLIDNGLLKIICECIKGDNKNEIIIGLEALSNLLSFGEKYNINGQNLIRDEVEKIGMYDFLEKLQHHRNENIYEKAYALVEKFFKCDYF